MPRFLFDHLENCTPLQPCHSCRAIALLKKELNEDSFKLFFGLARAANGVTDEVEKPKIPLGTPLEELHISRRLATKLRAIGCQNLGDVVQLSRAGLLAYRGIAEASVRELEEFFEHYGLRFRTV